MEPVLIVVLVLVLVGFVLQIVGAFKMDGGLLFDGFMFQVLALLVMMPFVAK